MKQTDVSPRAMPLAKASGTALLFLFMGSRAHACMNEMDVGAAETSLSLRDTGVKLPSLVPPIHDFLRRSGSGITESEGRRIGERGAQEA